MYIALIVLAALVAFCFGVGGFLFFAACWRGKEWDWLDEAAVAKTPYGKYNHVIQKGHAWLTEHNAQTVYMTTRDGLKLHGTWVPAENPRGTMILAHGYHSCILTDFTMVYRKYHEAGMNLLLPDERGHRRSEGKIITFGVKESKDFLEWADFHNKNLCDCPIVFSGLSMGAATVMYIADEAYPENTRGIIADCGFTSPAEIIGVVFTKTTHLPAWPFLWATDIFARILGGFSIYEKNTVKTLKYCKLPMILVHGLADDFVPCDMTKRSYEACGGPKELLLAQDAGHGLSFLHAGEEYWAMVEAFLDRVLEDNK